MSNEINNRKWITSIYSDQKLSLSFIEQHEKELNGIPSSIKAISQLKQSQSDTMSIVVAESLDCLELYDVEKINCLVLILPHSVTLAPNSRFSKAVVYRRKSDETEQAALEIIFKSLIRFTTSNYMFIDVQDIQYALSYFEGRYLRIFHYTLESFAKASEAGEFLDKLENNDSMMILLNYKEDAKKYAQMIDMILKPLEEPFNGDVFHAVLDTESPDLSNSFYILHACPA